MHAEYDFVVVGGGSAGCIIAQRLSAHSNASVALIESGPPKTDVRGAIPAWYPMLFGSTFDWRFQASPAPGIAGRKLAWPRGKALGGSTAINALIYLQAPNADFRRWGWACPSLPQPAQNSESTQCPFSQLPLRPVRRLHPWCKQFLQAADQAGLSRSGQMLQSEADDISLGQCGQYWLTQGDDDRRRHVGQQLDHGQTGNLHVLTESDVKCLLLQSGRVKGVTLAKNERQIVARREVILCCGTIGSPAILMRSGIGPARLLEAAKIRCVVDSPHVGQHLQDHLVYPIVYQGESSLGLPRRFDANERRGFRKGQPSSLASNIAEAGATFNLGEERTAFQIHATPTHYLKYPGLTTERNHMSLGITPLRPSSQGTIRLAPETHKPIIEPNYLSEPSDLDDFSQAITWVREQFSPRLAPLGWAEILPGPRGDKVNSLHRSIAAYSMSIYHPTSTCRMGDSIDNSVVGSDFTSHGIPGLRIADASVFPDIPASNTAAPTFWLAHQCATHILEEFT